MPQRAREGDEDYIMHSIIAPLVSYNFLLKVGAKLRNVGGKRHSPITGSSLTAPLSMNSACASF